MSQINSVYAQMQPMFTRSSDTGGSGKIMGRDASLIRAAHSQLQDAAEELSFTLDRSLDASLRARQEKGRTRTRSESAKDYCEALAEEDSSNTQEGKERHFDAFLSSEPDPELILREALRQWEYPEEAWANLNQAYERLKEQGANKDLLADLDEAVFLLERRFGGAIRAGIAGALVKDSPLAEPARERGNEYRQAVFECSSTFELFTSLLERHENDFSEAVEFLERALALDLSSETPSKDNEALRTFASSLGRLKLLRSADDQCKVLATPSLSNTAVLGKLMNLGNSAYPSGVDCEAIARAAGKTEIEDRILFLQSMLTCVRGFPTNLFDTDDGRSKVLDATQEAVDKAVEEEDQLYA